MKHRGKDLIRFYSEKYIKVIINQINIYYEKRCITLYSFYLEKCMLTRHLTKLILNLFSENMHDKNSPLMCTLHYYEPNAT